MSVFDIFVLTVIIAAFTTFGVVLGALTWYCSDKRKRPTDTTYHRHYVYPSGGMLITDDD